MAVFFAVVVGLGSVVETFVNVTPWPCVGQACFVTYAWFYRTWPLYDIYLFDSMHLSSTGLLRDIYIIFYDRPG